MASCDTLCQQQSGRSAEWQLPSTLVIGLLACPNQFEGELGTLRRGSSYHLMTQLHDFVDPVQILSLQLPLLVFGFRGCIEI